MPTYRAEVTPTAKKQILALDTVVRRRVEAAIVKLEDDPFPPGVTAMKGDDGTYRIRVGDYRVLYAVDGGKLLVLVVKVAHRRESYR